MHIIMRKTVVASDSFKGCLSSAQVADAVEKGIHEVYPDCEERNPMLCPHLSCHPTGNAPGAGHAAGYCNGKH